MFFRGAIVLIAILGQVWSLPASSRGPADETRSFPWAPCRDSPSQSDTCTTLRSADGSSVEIRRILGVRGAGSDAPTPVLNYFATTANGRLRPLDKRILIGLRSAASALGTELVTPSFAIPVGVRSELDESLVQYLTYHIDERGNQYCMTYFARYPFSGKATYCEEGPDEDALRFTRPFLFPRLITWAAEVLKVNGLQPGEGIDVGPSQIQLQVLTGRVVQLTCIWPEWLSAASPRKFRFTMDATSGKLKSLDLPAGNVVGR